MTLKCVGSSCKRADARALQKKQRPCRTTCMPLYLDCTCPASESLVSGLVLSDLIDQGIRRVSMGRACIVTGSRSGRALPL